MEYLQLGALARIFRGYRGSDNPEKAEEYAKRAMSYLYEGEDPVLTKMIHLESVDDDGILTVTDTDMPLSPFMARKYRLREGDIVIPRGPTAATNGCKVLVVDEEPLIPYIPNGNTYVIRPYKNAVDPYYLAAYFETNEAFEDMDALVTGESPIKLVPIGNLNCLEIPLPEEEVQQKIGAAYKTYKDMLIAVKEYKKELRDRQKDVFDNVLDDEFTSPKREALALKEYLKHRSKRRLVQNRNG